MKSLRPESFHIPANFCLQFAVFAVFPCVGSYKINMSPLLTWFTVSQSQTKWKDLIDSHLKIPTDEKALIQLLQLEYSKITLLKKHLVDCPVRKKLNWSKCFNFGSINEFCHFFCPSSSLFYESWIITLVNSKVTNITFT